MKALVYYRSVLRFMLGKALNRIRPHHFFSSITPVNLREMPLEAPPGWIPLKPHLWVKYVMIATAAGICLLQIGHFMISGLQWVRAI